MLGFIIGPMSNFTTSKKQFQGEEDTFIMRFTLLNIIMEMDSIMKPLKQIRAKCYDHFKK
jgi:hypothetical protein